MKPGDGRALSGLHRPDLPARVCPTCNARFFGGEEFCCLLPQTPLANAQILAERFRTAIGGKPVAHQDLALEVSISLGVTEASGTDTRKSLMQRVDEALYAAKEAGRNRVVLLPPEA